VVKLTARWLRRAPWFSRLLTGLAWGAIVGTPVGAQDTPGVSLVDTTDLTVYVGQGCPHCARALVWLDSLRAAQPGLSVQVFDVVGDAVALERLAALSRDRGLGGVTVPTFVVAGESIEVGFDRPATTGTLLIGLLREAGRLEAVIGSDAGPEPFVVSLPLIGAVRLEEVGLPLFTVAMGLLDGFNPCAMWVLLFLLSILVNVRSRTRMAVIGGVFVLVSGIVYFAFMAAWLNTFRLLGMARGIQVGLGGLALLLGGLNVKDAFWMGRGPSLGIPDAAKPGIYARVRRIVAAERLAPALGAVIVQALMVNTVELLCTAGLPALYTRILTLRELPTWTYYAYLGLYNVFYMLDDAAILAVAIGTLSHHRLQQKEARGLKLVSGVVMFALGVVLIVQPGWLLG
jgi:glutaredoxin